MKKFIQEAFDKNWIALIISAQIALFLTQEREKWKRKNATIVVQ